MRRFAFLGTSGAVPSAERDTISLVFEDDAGMVLVDCGGSPVQRLRRLGLDPLRLSRVVVTHLHPDHAGCAGWLSQQFDAELSMTRDEYLLCRILVADTGKATPPGATSSGDRVRARPLPCSRRS